MRHIRIGKNRKVKWKRPKGRHSKMRKRRKSYPSTVEIGYKSEVKTAGRVNGLIPILVHNTNDLAKIGKNNGAIIAKVGAKKKLDIIKVAMEKNIKLLNVKNNQPKTGGVKGS